MVRALDLLMGDGDALLLAQLSHQGGGVLEGLPSPFSAIRYHSLCATTETLPPTLEVTAKSDSGVIMGLKHREHPVYGVQFHPESILTEHGKDLLKNFLGMAA